MIRRRETSTGSFVTTRIHLQLWCVRSHFHFCLPQLVKHKTLPTTSWESRKNSGSRSKINKRPVYLKECKKRLDHPMEEQLLVRLLIRESPVNVSSSTDTPVEDQL